MGLSRELEPVASVRKTQVISIRPLDLKIMAIQCVFTVIFIFFSLLSLKSCILGLPWWLSG